MSIPTYRSIPFSTRMVILFGGFKSQFGWFFFGFGLIFFWAFAMNADLSFVHYKGELITTEGIAIRWQGTDASEGEVPVFKNYFRFNAEDGIEHEGLSYATGEKVQTGEPLQIEYPLGKPKYARIKGMRRQMFGPEILWVILFPLIGLIFISFGLRRSFRVLKLLKYGELTTGVLISKARTNTKINGRVVYRLTFQYEDESGEEYTINESTPIPYLLQDQKEERLLYLRSKPAKAVMLDSIPVSGIINKDGFVRGSPKRNMILLMLIPTATIFGHGIYLLSTYFN